MRAVVEHHAEDPRARVIRILHHLFEKRPFRVVGRHVADALAEVDFLSKVGHEFRGFIGGHAERGGGCGQLARLCAEVSREGAVAADSSSGKN